MTGTKNVQISEENGLVPPLGNRAKVIPNAKAMLIAKVKAKKI